MTERTTKRESGAFYRKQKRLKLEERQKMSGSIEKFFKGSPDFGPTHIKAGSSTMAVEENIEVTTAGESVDPSYDSNDENVTEINETRNEINEAGKKVRVKLKKRKS